jgi:hypothetical protein
LGQVALALPVAGGARAVFATLLCMSVICATGEMGLAQTAQFPSAFASQRQTAADRRSLIIALLVSRGVQSPLLPQRDAVSDAAPPGATLASAPPESDAPVDSVARLLSLIASAEAGAEGYDAVNQRAMIRPPKPPTELTIEQIFTWIDETPGQNHAIGRYQIIPMTLAYLVVAEGIPQDAIYSPELQDRLARRLLDKAGLQEFIAGLLPAADFQDKLAYVWAGLPLGSGLSAYDGIAGNKATITRKEYEDRFGEIFGRADRMGLAAASGAAAVRTAGN